MKRQIILGFLMGFAIEANLSASEKESGIYKQVTRERLLDMRYINAWLEFDAVANVPEEFVAHCCQQLDEFPEANGPLRLIAAARDYVASSYHLPEEKPKSEMIKRYYHTIVAHAHHNKITPVAAREIINDDEVLLGYVLHGQQNKRVSKKEWKTVWTKVKRALSGFAEGMAVEFGAYNGISSVKHDLPEDQKSSKHVIRRILCAGKDIGNNAASVTKKRTLENEANQKHFSLSLPTVPNVCQQDIEKYCFQMSGMEEENCSCFWSKAMDRALTNLEYKDEQLKPIMNRYIEAIISLTHKENVSVEAAKDKIQKNMSVLGYIIYGRSQRTSPSKWNTVRKKLFEEISSDGGLESELPGKYKRLT